MALLQWLKECSKPSLFVVTIFLVAVLKFLMKEKLKKRKLNLPPSPVKLPIIGNLHQLGNMPHISLRGLAKKYGPIIFLQLGEIPTLFAPYGAYWRNVRKICILELLSAKRVHWYSFVREEEVARLICRIAESSPGITNLSSMIALYANFQVEDSVLETIFL
ncbi:hypothetical protein NC652_010300 [Populus alba x Populus x berolinensis]|nr:hypothetical protein NC652_010300 [Populus alba x Populus x berolinensis]